MNESPSLNEKVLKNERDALSIENMASLLSVAAMGAGISMASLLSIATMDAGISVDSILVTINTQRNKSIN